MLGLLIGFQTIDARTAATHSSSRSASRVADHLSIVPPDAQQWHIAIQPRESGFIGCVKKDIWSRKMIPYMPEQDENDSDLESET